MYKNRQISMRTMGLVNREPYAVSRVLIKFCPDCLGRPLIDEWELRRDFLWRMMRAQTDADGPNALPDDGFKYTSFGDVDDDDVKEPHAMDDDHGRNASGYTPVGPFGGNLKSDDRLVALNPNGNEDWWTLCQLPVFIVLFAVIGVLAVTFVVSFF